MIYKALAVFSVLFSIGSVSAASSCKDFVQNYLTQDGQLLDEFNVEDNPNFVVSIVPKSSGDFKKLKVDQSGSKKKQTYVKAKRSDKDGKVKSMGREYRVKLLQKGGKLKEIKRSYPLSLFNTQADEVVTFEQDINGECYPESYKKGKELIFSATLCRELHQAMNAPGKDKALQCLVENMDLMKDLTKILSKHDEKFKDKIRKRSKSTKTALGVSYKVLTSLENCSNYGLYPSIDDAVSGGYDPADYFITNPASWEKQDSGQDTSKSQDQTATAN